MNAFEFFRIQFPSNPRRWVLRRRALEGVLFTHLLAHLRVPWGEALFASHFVFFFSWLMQLQRLDDHIIRPHDAQQARHQLGAVRRGVIGELDPVAPAVLEDLQRKTVAVG